MKYTIYILGFVFALFSYGCHSKNELGLNEGASIDNLGDLPENPLLLNAITSAVDPKDSIMAVLYGNDLAFDHLASNAASEYPSGAILYEVTWQLEADEQWFGANTPHKVKTIERIEFGENNAIEYQLFKGHILQNSGPVEPSKRIAVILGQRIAVSP